MSQSKPDSWPTAEEAARRLVILKYIVVSALAAPPRDMLNQLMSQWGADERANFERQAEEKRDQFLKYLKAPEWWPHLSPREQAHAQTTLLTMSPRQHTDASWRVEAVQTLMWALGSLPALPAYDTPANPKLLVKIPSREVAQFIRSARLRGADELEGARANAEFWHWRSRTRQLIERGAPFTVTEQMSKAGIRGFDDIVRLSARQAAQDGTIPPCIDEDFPAHGKAYRDLTDEEWAQVQSITVERHYTLNWLCGFAPGNQWDETPTDT